MYFDNQIKVRLVNFDDDFRNSCVVSLWILHDYSYNKETLLILR